MAQITCHRTGRTFDYDAVPRTPFRFVPGTAICLDMDGVNFYFPEPSPSDPRSNEKALARAEAVADAEAYAAANEAAKA